MILLTQIFEIKLYKQTDSGNGAKVLKLVYFLFLFEGQSEIIGEREGEITLLWYV